MSILAFVERMVRDSEFREWYVARPREALASHGLDGESLQQLYHVLEWGGPYRQTAHLLKPLVDYLVACWKGGDEEDVVVVRQRYEHLTGQIEKLKGRTEFGEAFLRQSRPWWKFWEW